MSEVVNWPPAPKADVSDTAPSDNSAEASLRETTQDWLREAILDGRYKAGEKLIERELSELTGASRSVLREALSHMEAKGLIVRQSFRGYKVAQLSIRSIYEIFELRSVVETLAAELFTERASEHELAEIGAAYVALDAGIKANDLKRIRNAKEWFFSVLFTGCRNTEIHRAMENVIDRISHLRTQLMSDPRRRQDSLIEMRRLTIALQDRNRVEARAASLAHLESARDALVWKLSEAAQKSGPNALKTHLKSKVDYTKAGDD